MIDSILLKFCKGDGYNSYWLGYMEGHQKPLTRILHYFGLFFGQVFGIFASIFVVWWAYLIIGPVSYFVAFISHPLSQGNTNEPFKAMPLWSIASFFRMMLLDATGRFHDEISRLKSQR